MVLQHCSECRYELAWQTELTAHHLNGLQTALHHYVEVPLGDKPADLVDHKLTMLRCLLLTGSAS